MDVLRSIYSAVRLCRLLPESNICSHVNDVLEHLEEELKAYGHILKKVHETRSLTRVSDLGCQVDKTPIRMKFTQADVQATSSY